LFRELVKRLLNVLEKLSVRKFKRYYDDSKFVTLLRREVKLLLRGISLLQNCWMIGHERTLELGDLIQLVLDVCCVEGYEPRIFRELEKLINEIEDDLRKKNLFRVRNTSNDNR